MQSSAPLVPMDLQQVGLESNGKNVIIALEAGGKGMAVRFTPLQAADMALKVFNWTARHADQTTHCVQMPPVMAADLEFRAGSTEESIAVAFDLGAVTAQFEVTRAQLVAAMMQLRPVEGAPPSPH